MKADQPRRKVTVTGRMIVEFTHSEYRDIDVDRDEYAAELLAKIVQFPFTVPELRLVSLEHTSTKGSKEKTK
jgi:hypothetical protein